MRRYQKWTIPRLFLTAWLPTHRSAKRGVIATISATEPPDILPWNDLVAAGQSLNGGDDDRRRAAGR